MNRHAPIKDMLQKIEDITKLKCNLTILTPHIRIIEFLYSFIQS